MEESKTKIIIKTIGYQLLTLAVGILFTFLASYQIDEPLIQIGVYIILFFFGIKEIEHMMTLVFDKEKLSKIISLTFRLTILLIAFICLYIHVSIPYISFKHLIYFYLDLVIFDIFTGCKRKGFYFIGVILIFLLTYGIFYYHCQDKFIFQGILFFNSFVISVKLGYYIYDNHGAIDKRMSVITYSLIHLILIYLKLTLLFPILRNPLLAIIKYDFYSPIASYTNNIFFKIILGLCILINIVAFIASFYEMEICKKCWHINTLEVLNCNYTNEKNYSTSETKKEKVGSHIEKQRVLVDGMDPQKGYFCYYENQDVVVDDYADVTKNYNVKSYDKNVKVRCCRCQIEYVKSTHHHYRSEK